MTAVAADLLERVRQSLAVEGADPTPTRVADALRTEGTLLDHAAVLDVVDTLRRETLGAGPLQPLLRSDGVTDVVVNGAAAVYVDRGDGLEPVDVTFPDDDAVRRLAQRLAAAGGRRLDDACPSVDVRLADGTRCHAVLAPIARPGTAISLRVPARRTFSLRELVDCGSLSAGGGQLLRALVDSRAAFLVTGGTGSGKTTLLSSLLGLVDPRERLVLVEDSSELPHELVLHTMRAAIYLRQSLDRNGDAAAVGRQREAAEELCARRGWTVVETYTDNDRSGSSGKPRPAYVEMLAAVERGEVDVIVGGSHFDRLTRNARERLRLIETGKAHRTVVSLVQGSDLDMSTASGRMTADVLGAVAQNEIEVKAERQQAANLQRAKDGKLPGGPAPFGWRSDGTHDPAQARHLQRAYRDVLAGAKLKGIATDWNARGIESSRGRTAWTHTTLRRRLLDPRNAGRRVLNGADVGEGDWRPIVDRDTFEAVKTTLTDKARRTTNGPYGRRYLLSNLALCGRCGERVTTGRAERGHRTYRCRTGHLSRKADPLDALVVDVIVGRLSRPDAAELLRRDDAPEADALADRSVVLRSRLDDLSTSLAEGLLDIEGVRRESSRLRAELADVEARLHEPDRAAVLADLVTAGDAARVWESLALDRRRAVVDALVKITVTPPVKGSRTITDDALRIRWKR